MILRLVLFLIVVLLSAFVPTWLFVLCVVLYALMYTAYELIVLMCIIDALYGIGYGTLIPYYTIVTTCSLICIEWVKPHISVYNQ